MLTIVNFTLERKMEEDEEKPKVLLDTNEGALWMAHIDRMVTGA